jgi:hypothetical protein
MKLTHIRALGVAGLADLELSLLGGDAPAGFVAIKGPPGSGKSRLLKLLVHCKERIGAYGPLRPDKAFATEAAPAKVSLEWRLDEDERLRTGAPRQQLPAEIILPTPRGLQLPTDPSLVDLLSHFDLDPERSKVDYFPVDRDAGRRAVTAGDPRVEQKRLRLGDSAPKYASLKQLALHELRAAGKRRAPLLELFREATGLALEGDSSRGALARSRGGSAVPVADLSSSEWDAFVVASSIVLLGLRRSLLLFDTPELHLPSEEAARRFALYRRATPEAQWIVATNDARILAEAQVVIDLGAAHDR